LGASLGEGLRGKDVFYFAGSDTECQCSKCSMRTGVAVAADDGHAGLGDAELRADDVDDTLLAAADVEEFDAELLAVLAQRRDLPGCDLIDDVEAFRQRSRDVVIDGGNAAVWAANFAAGESQSFEGLRRGHFVQQLEIDIEQGRFALGLGDDVLLPYFFEERSWCVAHISLSGARVVGEARPWPIVLRRFRGLACPFR
jgi:hypothetical protein